MSDRFRIRRRADPTPDPETGSREGRAGLRRPISWPLWRLPDFCIPPPPPDLDCGDIDQKDFTVHQPGPHRFDGNRDGRGCEN